MYHHSQIVGNGVSCGCHTERNLKSFTFYGAEKGASDLCDWVRNGELRGSEAASSAAGPANVAICCVPGNITSQFITRPSRVDSLTELPKKCYYCTPKTVDRYILDITDVRYLDFALLR